MPQGSRSYDLFWQLIAHYGLDEQNLETVALSPQKANQAIAQGEVDALFRVSALRNQGLIDLLQNPQMNLVPINQGGALQLLLPALEASEIPRGTYHGAIPVPNEDLPSVAVRAVLVTHPDLEQDIVYERMALS